MLPAGHPRVATVRQGLGRLALDRGDIDGAESLFRDAHDNLLDAYGPEDARTAEAGRLLAVCLAVLGRNEEAEALLRECSRVLEAEYGEGDERARRARQELESLYDERARPTPATYSSDLRE